MGRRSKKEKTASFTSLPHGLQDCYNFNMLTPIALKLLINISRQYNGYNNGDLCCTFSVMKKHGWKSKATLDDARDCLVHYGMITLARQGGRNKCSLFAITWQKIHDHFGKLDVPSTTRASGEWKTEVPTWQPKRKRN